MSIAGSRMKTPLATCMEEEAGQAPDVVARLLVRNVGTIEDLGERLRDSRPRAVITCARGSSDHAATFARYLIETRLGVLTSSAAPSVSSIYRAQTELEGVVVLAISQSGASPDLLATVRTARAGGAYVVALVNVEGSPLAELAHVAMPLCAGPETSVAATKSFLASLASIVQLVAAWARDRSLSVALADLPDLLGRAWELDWRLALESLRTAESSYIVARGLGLGAAQEWALKLKETCRLHAEAHSAAEVRHGPLALVAPGFPVVVLAQRDETYASVMELASDVIGRGARVLLAGGTLPGAVCLPTLEAHPVLEPLLATQSFYRLVSALAIARGLDPDRPAHLQKVTRTL